MPKNRDLLKLGGGRLEFKQIELLESGSRGFGPLAGNFSQEREEGEEEAKHTAHPAASVPWGGRVLGTQLLFF